MDNSPRQQYPNPTVAEAVCELHFTMDDFISEDALFEGVQSKLRENYPIAERELIQYFAARVSTQDIGLLDDTSKSIPKAIYKHKDGGHLIQLTPNLLTVNMLPKYLGWDSVIAALKSAIEALHAISTQFRIDQIGIRYINLIPRKLDTDTVGTYLNATNFIPPVLLQQKENYASRLELKNNNQQNIIVGVHSLHKTLTDLAPIIFDIEVFKDNFTTSDANQIIEEWDALHVVVWDIFRISSNANLLKVLQGVQ